MFRFEDVQMVGVDGTTIETGTCHGNTSLVGRVTGPTCIDVCGESRAVCVGGEGSGRNMDRCITFGR